MLGRDIIELVVKGDRTGKDEYGNPTYTTTYKEVFANELVIGQSEFYQSHAQDLRPTKKYEIRTAEYDGESAMRIGGTDGVVYDIIRSYAKNSEWIELTGQGVVLDANA